MHTLLPISIKWFFQILLSQVISYQRVKQNCFLSRAAAFLTKITKDDNNHPLYLILMRLFILVVLPCPFLPFPYSLIPPSPPTPPTTPNRRHNCACHPSQALKTIHWNYHLQFLCVFHITKAEKVRYGQPSMMRSSFRLTESCDTFCDKLFWEDTSPTLNINMFVFSKYVLALIHKHCMFI